MLVSKHEEVEKSDFPLNQPPYLGPMSDTYHSRDHEGAPLSDYVTVYNSGFYSDLPTRPVETEKPDEKHHDIADSAKALGKLVRTNFWRNKYFANESKFYLL
jgi:hypothetical protein